MNKREPAAWRHNGGTFKPVTKRPLPLLSSVRAFEIPATR
jgi:hypothetical protein